MKYRHNDWTLGEIGDVLPNGLRIGDPVSHPRYKDGWVSNIWSDEESYVQAREHPDTWEHGEPAHGSWGSVKDAFPFVTDKEIAEVFGLKELP